MFVTDFKTDDISADPVRRLYEYWQSKFKGEMLPGRADIKPREIQNLLPFVSLIDVEKAPLRFKGRLIGSETVNAFGHNMTGRYFDEIPETEITLERFSQIVEKKHCYLLNESLNWSSRSFLKYCSVAMPLSENGEDVNMLFFGNYFYFPEEEREQYPPQILKEKRRWL